MLCVISKIPERFKQEGEAPAEPEALFDSIRVSILENNINHFLIAFWYKSRDMSWIDVILWLKFSHYFLIDMY